MKCSYCEKDYDVHKGMTLVMKDGKVHHFCSAKCRKNQKMIRRSVKWIKDKKKIKKKK
jgi:ribosomal protein L24E